MGKGGDATMEISGRKVFPLNCFSLLIPGSCVNPGLQDEIKDCRSQRIFY